MILVIIIQLILISGIIGLFQFSAFLGIIFATIYTFFVSQYLFHDINMRVEDVFGCVMIGFTFFIVYTSMSLIVYLNVMDGISTKSNNSCINGLMSGNLESCVGDTTNMKISDMMKPMESDWGNMLNDLGEKSRELVKVKNTFKLNMNFNLGKYVGLQGKMYVIVTQIQIMMAKLYDSFNRMLGSVMSLNRLLDTGILTAKSVVMGPIGSHVKLLIDWGFCFHPDTIIILRNGNKKRIKHIKVGDTLKNGSQVMGTVTVKGNLNTSSNPYYSIYSRELNEKIYVTGSHKMRMKGISDYIKTDVKDCPYATLESHIKTKYFTCLITSDHLIQIGEHTFFDWEY